MFLCFSRASYTLCYSLCNDKMCIIMFYGSLDRRGVWGRIDTCICMTEGFPGGSEVKASASSAGDLGSIPGSERSSGEGNGNPLQYSCLENPLGGGAW